MLKLDMNLVWNMINLIVLYLLLRHFLIKPVTDIMEKRKKLIEDGLENARSAQEDAMKMKREYEESLKGARRESVSIIEKARREAKAEYDRIVSEAGGRAEDMIESAKETVRIEREKTVGKLRTEIAGLALMSAAKIVGENAGDMKTAEIYDQFLKEADEDRGNGDGNNE